MSDKSFEQIMAEDAAAQNQALTSSRAFAFTGLKTFNGREGEGYSANVTVDGKKIGEVIEEGCGGAPLLRISAADRKNFMAEARKFYPADALDWHVEEGYCEILSIAADISRKRKVFVATDDNTPGGGEFMVLSGTQDVAQVASYLLSDASGVAGKNPLVWIKGQGRFIPAKEIAG